MGLLTLWACAEPAAVDGTVVDARTGAALPDLAITLAPSDDRCPPLAAKSDAMGRFTAANLCPGEPYRVAADDPGWRSPGPVETRGGAVDLRVWRVPAADGVYTLEATKLAWLTTNTAIDTATVLDSTSTVRLPVEIPGALPRIAGGGALMLAGGAIIDSLRFSPLIPSEKRWFGTREAPQAIDPWVYLGVRFASDLEFTTVEARPDPPVDLDFDGRRLRVIGAGALPAGRYALAAPDGARAFLLDFGP